MKMGSVGFIGEDECQPSTSNCKKKRKLSRKLLNDCNAVNYASVPRKLRSAINNRRREFISQALPILSGKQLVSIGVPTTKNREKKSILNTKKGRVTKDEKEVAETLYALADMFSDATKSNETKSSTIMEAAEGTDNLRKREESKKISQKVAIEAASYSSNLVDSTSKFVKVESLNESQQCDLAIDKQSDTLVIQSDSSLISRQKMSSFNTIPSDEMAVAPAPVATPCVQYGKDRSFGTYQSPSLCPSRDLSSKKKGSCQRLPAWLENAICTPKPQRVTGDSINVDKVETESKASWKRCSAHVYISRLIKVLRISEEKPCQSTTCRAVEIGGPSFSIPYRKDGRNDVVSSDGITNSGAELQNAILLHKRLLQDQQLPFNTSVLCAATKQGSDFPSVSAGDYPLDDGASINGAWNNHEALKRRYALYLQSQNPCMQPQNGYSTSNFHGCTSAVTPQQVQHPPFRFNSLESNVTEPFGQKSGLQQFQLQDRYNHGGVAADIPYLADNWQNGGRHSSSQLNYYAQSLFPHSTHSALGSNYQQVSPAQHFASPQLHKNWLFATPTNL